MIKHSGAQKMHLTLTLNLLLLVVTICSCAETYYNSSEICKKCDCQRTDSRNSLTLDCSYEGLGHVLSNWPPHGDVLVAIFSHNTIPTLERLPSSDARVELVFDHCGIVSLDGYAFADVKDVDMVDLSHNLLKSEGLTQDVFKGPYNKTVAEPLGLKRLNLAYNKILTLRKDLFKYLPNLVELNLEGNNMGIIDIQTQLALETLNNLQNLNLAHNMLTDLVKQAVTGLSSLREINLSSNDLDAVPDTLAEVGDTLEKLVIDNNPIFTLDENSFLGLHKMVELSLNNLTYLGGVKANTFSPMKYLKIVRLSNNQLLSYIDKDAFLSNHTLVQLYMNDNSLETLDRFLLNWSGLKMFQINGNRFYCDCDLYYIASQLPEQISRNEDGETCIDLRNHDNVQIFRLRADICNTQYIQSTYTQIKQNFTLLRVTLVVLTLTVITGMFVVIGISYARWARARRTQSYPFATGVTYNPLSSDRF